MAAEGERALLLAALPVLSAKVEEIVKQAREDYSSSDVSTFVGKRGGQGISRLFSAMPAYLECLEAVGVKTRAELKQFWARHYGNHDVREAVDAVLEEEDNFNHLVAEVDRQFSVLEAEACPRPPASVEQLLPSDLELIESPSGQPTSLGQTWKGSEFTLYIFMRHFG